jgi:membrane protease YdiL (CAAX protease family)
MLAGGFCYDLLMPRFQDQLFQRLHLVSRNSLALMMGLGLFWSRNRSKLGIRELVGRLGPTAKLLSVGIITFFFAGLGFWGFSYVIPFSVVLAPVKPMTIRTVTILLLSIVLIPLTEELLFRFHLYGYLRKTIGILPGILITSLIFSFLHGLGEPIVPVFLGALFMSALTEYTCSILPSLAFHAGFNFLLLCGGYWLPA